jgi:hypothetical protein
MGHGLIWGLQPAGEVEKKLKNFSCGGRFSGRDLDSGFLKYQAASYSMNSDIFPE